MERKNSFPLLSCSILFLIFLGVSFLAWLPFVDLTTEKITWILFLFAPIAGLMKNTYLIIFIIGLGGFTSLIFSRSTFCSFNLDRIYAIKKSKLKNTLFFSLIITAFSLGGTIWGMGEEGMVFVPLITQIAQEMGWGAFSGVAIIIFGTGIGALASIINPFVIQIALDSVPNVPVVDNSFLVVRVLIWFFFNSVGILIMAKYLLPQRSGGERSSRDKKSLSSVCLSVPILTKNKKRELLRQVSKKISIYLFAISIVIMVLTFIPWSSIFSSVPVVLQHWQKDPFLSLGLMFFFFSLFILIFNTTERFSSAAIFFEGVKQMLPTALLISLASATEFILIETGIGNEISEWIIHWLKLSNRKDLVWYCFFIFFFFSFFIPSTSALARLFFPIIGPVALSVGVLPEIVVVFSLASGIVNLFSPSSIVLAMNLGKARIQYKHYMKKMFIVLLCMFVLCILFVWFLSAATFLS